ncbi:MAG: epoxyqueuosine reductase [Eggerthellaceae bacterium]|nr:epoxyqueuosine reductase [Eggerthellaceae bacterium]
MCCGPMRLSDAIRSVFTEELMDAVNEFVRTSPLNAVPVDSVLRTGLDGARLIDDCVFAFGDASDPLFEVQKQPQAVGPQFMVPTEWLPEALSVISFFAPFSETVKASNRKIDGFPSGAWLHGRIDGQRVVFETCTFIVDWLEQRGFKAVVPSLDPRFKAIDDIRDEEGQIILEKSFRSNWSERHVAYVCGLGTFALSRGIITEKGISGRVGTVVTNAPLAFTKRPYEGLYDYCNRCGACAAHCPVNAISLETGKQQIPCWMFLEQTKLTCAAPYFGCGKCQAGVPCESRIPARD